MWAAGAFDGGGSRDSGYLPALGGRWRTAKPLRGGCSWGGSKTGTAAATFDEKPALPELPSDARKFTFEEIIAPIAALYAAERVAACAPRTVLLCSGSLWHRGTPVLPGKLRQKHHLSFRTAAATFAAGRRR